MEIGIFQLIADSNADPALVAKRVEDRGFHSYWLGEHTVVPTTLGDKYPRPEPVVDPPDYLPHLVDPLMGLARAAAVTERVRLGTAVSLPAERHPLLFAKQVATLDDHSGGRVLLGVGGGWSREQCEVLGGDPDHRWANVRDHVAAMKVLWHDDVSEYDGRYVTFPPVRCFPKPRTRPHPPILLGAGATPTAFRRVAEWGDGWMPHSIADLDAYADGVAEIGALARAAGRDPSTFDFSVNGVEGEFRTTEEVEAAREAGANRVNIWLDARKLEDILDEVDALAEVMRDLLV